VKYAEDEFEHRTICRFMQLN